MDEEEWEAFRTDYTGRLRSQYAKLGPIALRVMQSRTALRFLPWANHYSGNERNDHVLWTFRTSMVSAGLVFRPNVDFGAFVIAAQQAYSPATRNILNSTDFEGALDALDALAFLEVLSPIGEIALFALEKLGTREKIAPSAAEATLHDLAALETGTRPEQLFREPLWPNGETPRVLGSNWSELSAYLKAEPGQSEYWVDWYEKILAGTLTDLDIEISTRIAQIPAEIWDAEENAPRKVAAKIARIEAELNAGLLVEEIQFSAENRLTLVPQPMPVDPLLGHLLDTVADALEMVTSDLRNTLPEDCHAARLLRRTLSRYANDPQRIEIDFERTRKILMRDLAEDVIPSSSANLDLIDNLEQAAGIIRHNDPKIAANRKRLDQLEQKELGAESGARISEGAEEVAKISDAFLAEELRNDAARLPGARRSDPVPDPVVSLGAPERNVALEAQAAQLRLRSRLSRTWLYLLRRRDDLGRLLAMPEFQIAAFLGSLASILSLFL